MVLLFIVHEGSNGAALISMESSLSTDVDGSMANPKIVGGTRDSAEGRRHLSKCDGKEITGVVDGELLANGVPYIPLQLG